MTAHQLSLSTLILCCHSLVKFFDPLMGHPGMMQMEVFWLDDKDLGTKSMALALLAAGNEELLRHAITMAQEGGPYEIFESEQAGERFPKLRSGWPEPWASAHMALAIRDDIIALGFGANKKTRTRAAHLALSVHVAAVTRIVPSSLAEGHGKQLVDEAKKMFAARKEAREPAKDPGQGPEKGVEEHPREEPRHFEEPYVVFKTRSSGWLIAGPAEDF